MSAPTGPDARALLWQAREDLCARTDWLDYVRDVYTVDPAGYPMLTYVGLNFTADAIKNFKFYFSFFKPLEDDEISRLLPVEDRGHFDQMYATWHPTHRYETIHRGVTFALKVAADGTLTHYYHLRTPTMPFGPPLRLEVAPSDEGNYHGVCEEFTGGQRALKRYYYLRDPQTVADSLQVAGFGDLLDQMPSIQWLEYIESETRDKADWVTANPYLVGSLVEDRGPPRLASALAKLCHDCGFELFAPGSAKDGRDHAIYFIEPAGPASGGGFIFDGVRTFLQRYLRLPVEM